VQGVKQTRFLQSEMKKGLRIASPCLIWRARQDLDPRPPDSSPSLRKAIARITQRAGCGHQAPDLVGITFRESSQVAPHQALAGALSERAHSFPFLMVAARR
jgi:hypothetical protein